MTIKHNPLAAVNMVLESFGPKLFVCLTSRGAETSSLAGSKRRLKKAKSNLIQ